MRSILTFEEDLVSRVVREVLGQTNFPKNEEIIRGLSTRE
jgi:hypothetical protein